MYTHYVNISLLERLLLTELKLQLTEVSRGGRLMWGGILLKIVTKFLLSEPHSVCTAHNGSFGEGCCEKNLVKHTRTSLCMHNKDSADGRPQICQTGAYLSKPMVTILETVETDPNNYARAGYTGYS